MARLGCSEKVLLVALIYQQRFFARMNQLYFHSQGLFFAITDRNSYFLLAICVVLAAKFYEEPCFFNAQQERFYFERDYFKATHIPPAHSKSLQLYLMKKIDHRLFVSEEEYNDFAQKVFGFFEAVACRSQPTANS
mmetsp:Transcript_3360/g.2320  ORF Transcript_3360/g.2320 Transcript_3360/m.2320 type:complete len:136 (+) Transcript_3360:433-840(+)